MIIYIYTKYGQIIATSLRLHHRWWLEGGSSSNGLNSGSCNLPRYMYTFLNIYTLMYNYKSFLFFSIDHDQVSMRAGVSTLFQVPLIPLSSEEVGFLVDGSCSSETKLQDGPGKSFFFWHGKIMENHLYTWKKIMFDIQRSNC